MNSDALVCEVRMRAPLRPAAEAPTTRRLMLLRLFDADIEAYGEAAPLEPYDGVSIDQVAAAFRAYGPALRDADRLEHEEILAACVSVDPLPQALAAVDLALWNLAGLRAGKPAAELLGVDSAAAIEVNATIGAVEPRAAAQEALEARESGFSIVKVKVGTPDDRQRLQAIRDAVGPDLRLRLDANGAWDQLTAPERIRALSKFDVELFEEPAHGIAATEAVALTVPAATLAVDETAASALDTSAHRICDAVCLKIAASGGITGLIKDAKRARELGYEVYIASTLDGPLGIAAALHAAAAVNPDRPCGLATLDRFDRPNPLTAVGGHMHVPTGPGLGDGLSAWYAPARHARPPDVA